MQSAMKVHDAAKGLVPSASTLPTSLSANDLKPERKYGNVVELIAAKFVDLLKDNILIDFL